MKAALSAAVLVVGAAAYAVVPAPRDMRGPFPIMSTPYHADGAVDYEALGREARWVADCGCPGVIWCQSNDAIDLLTMEEKFRGFEACAVAVEGLDIVMTLGANGTNATEMLEIAAEIERVAERHPRAKIAMISRPPDDVRSQEAIESAWDELGRLSKRPVIFQTYGTKDTPTPAVELIARLANRHPHAFGYVKEEAAGWEANERMVRESAARPAMKTVFAGWGGWQWLLQLRHCGIRRTFRMAPIPPARSSGGGTATDIRNPLPHNPAWSGPVRGRCCAASCSGPGSVGRCRGEGGRAGGR